MKKVSVVVPTYNEEKNVSLIYDRLKNVFKDLPYMLEIIFIDNYSTDCTRTVIEELCQIDDRVRAIFNARNFGFSRSVYHGLISADGDCAVLVFADMQDPPEVIKEFLAEWEKGSKVVVGMKSHSRESRWMYFIRSCYYKLIRKISDVEHIEQFDGFGLYDASFIKVLRELDDPMPYLRGIVAELGYSISTVQYTQAVREHGTSSFNFFKMYDVAMMGITSYSKVFIRMATFVGFLLSLMCVVISAGTFLLKMFWWDHFPIGTAAIIIGVFFLGAIQLFFIGMLGEYLLGVSVRSLHRPLVVEERRINFH